MLSILKFLIIVTLVVVRTIRVVLGYILLCLVSRDLTEKTALPRERTSDDSWEKF